MRSNLSYLLKNRKTGECYIPPDRISRSLQTVWFKVPVDKLPEIRGHLRRYRNRLYTRLKQIDKNFYVFAERVPGQGFESVIPATPAYDPDRVLEVRDFTLKTIEDLFTEVAVHYYINPVTLKVTGSLEYPSRTGDVNGKQHLLLEGDSVDTTTADFEYISFESLLTVPNKKELV